MMMLHSRKDNYYFPARDCCDTSV